MWWVLTDGVMDLWLSGLPALLFVTLLSVMLISTLSCPCTGSSALTPVFQVLNTSWCGREQVRYVATVAISQGLLDNRFLLPPGLSRIIMVNIFPITFLNLNEDLDE